MLESLLQVTIWASFLIVFLFYLSYFLVLHNSYKKSERCEKSLGFYYPYSSLIVPLYNEEKIIRRKIKNIEQLDYPKDKIEIIFVDGCSTDRTSEIIENCIENCDKSLKLIKQDQRGGYNTGISEGIQSSKGEIIVVTDAGTYHDPDAIKHLVKHFEDNQVGAVTGKEVVLSSRKNELGPKLEAVYRDFYDFMRIAETKMDSTPDSKGEILAVRRNVCMGVLARLELSPNASFDCCIPYQAKLQGYRTVYEPRATYCEHPPATFMDRMRQQIRRASILIGSMLLFKSMLMKKKYNKFGLIIMPAHFVMLMILPWLILSGLICFSILTILDPIWLVLWVILLIPLFVARSRLFLISFLQSQLALVIAAFRVAMHSKSQFIDTISSTRAHLT